MFDAESDQDSHPEDKSHRSDPSSPCQEEGGLRTTVSYHRDPDEAAAQLAEGLLGESLGFVLFFCSAEYDLEGLEKAIARHFQDVPVVGCTTAGEITPDGYGQGCITAVGFCNHTFSICAKVVDDLDHFTFLEAQQVVAELVQQCQSRDVAPIKGHSFALTLVDGLSSLEERFLVTLNSAFGSIPNFGGSAGDDELLANTHVFCGGRFHTGAAVVVLINTPCRFDVFTTHHMVQGGEKLVVTRADCEQRRVYELNAEPAALEYARAVGIPVEELNNMVFALNPIGVRIGNEYFVRSIQQVHDDMSLTFYCAVENGIVMTVLDPVDLLDDLTHELRRINSAMGETRLVIGCDCFLRRVELDHRGLKDQGSRILRDNKVIGFNTYGEQIGGMHINQTFTGVAIGRCDSDD